MPSFDQQSILQPAGASVAVGVIAAVAHQQYFQNLEIRYLAPILSGIFAVAIILGNPRRKENGNSLNVVLWLINGLLICALAMGGNELYAKAFGPSGTPPQPVAAPPPDPGLPKEIKREEPHPPIASSVFSPLTLIVDKNASYLMPAVPAGDGGHLLKVDLAAPGDITAVDFECIGESCGWVHECPDGGKCGARDRLAIADGKATWNAWSNSGAPAKFIFRVHYR